MKPFYQVEKLGDELLPAKFFITLLSEGEYIAPHWHDFLEILYFCEGNAKIQINASYFDIKSGEAVVLNSLDVHSISGTAKYYVLEDG
jgi:AraC family transcriptional activator of pobA